MSVVRRYPVHCILGTLAVTWGMFTILLWSWWVATTFIAGAVWALVLADISRGQNE